MRRLPSVNSMRDGVLANLTAKPTGGRRDYEIVIVQSSVHQLISEGAPTQELALLGIDGVVITRELQLVEVVV